MLVSLLHVLGIKCFYLISHVHKIILKALYGNINFLYMLQAYKIPYKRTCVHDEKYLYCIYVMSEPNITWLCQYLLLP